jgi:outer membrane protein assembly factor BamB
MRRIVLTAALITASAVVAAAPGEFDWPQWRGPDRTNLSKETGLLKEWPEGGPKQAWKITGLGDGYSTPSISAGHIYLLGTVGNDEHMICLKETDGSKVWSIKIGQKMGGFPGPRSTPTIDGGHAYAVSSDGNLVCVAIDKGTVKWQKSYRKDFGGQAGSWAYAESPLVDGDWVIGTPGARSAALVAFKKTTGEVVWKTDVGELARKPPPEPKKVDPKRKGRNRPGRSYAVAGYSSVVKADIGGVKQYVQFVDGGVIGVSARDGKFLWHYDEPANSTANISTPIIRGDLVFAASAYGTGGGQVRIVKKGTAFEAEQQYFVRQMQNHHGGMVLVGDQVYGTGGGTLLCVNFKTGDVAWNERSVGKGSVTYADGHLYVRGENGKLALVEANPEKYVEKGRFDQPDRSKQAAWPHPVVANGKLYVRDWDVLLCYDVKAK